MERTDKLRAHTPVAALASAPGGQRLPHLDGLRGIAAIAVMLYHVHNVFHLTLGFERAYLFVDIFFMLSGFVLSLAWSSVFSQDFNALVLLKARVKRLWPTIIIAAILGAAVHAFLGDEPHIPMFAVLALLVLPAISNNGEIFPLNGPQWTVFWEILANVAHVLLLRRLGERGLMAVILVMGLSMVLAIGWWGADDFGTTAESWWLALARVGWSYAVGMQIARLYQASNWRPILPWWLGLALPIVLVLALPWLPLSTATGDALLTVVIFPPLFWLLVTAHPPVMASSFLKRLGALSFPLYAAHLPLVMLFAALDISRIISATLAVTVALTLSICASCIGGNRNRALSQNSLVNDPQILGKAHLR